MDNLNPNPTPNLTLLCFCITWQRSSQEKEGKHDSSNNSQNSLQSCKPRGQQCKQPAASGSWSPCRGGDDAGSDGNGYCQENHHGPRCELCVGEPYEHYFDKKDARCHKCSDVGMQLFAMLAFLAGLLLAASIGGASPASHGGASLAGRASVGRASLPTPRRNREQLSRVRAQPSQPLQGSAGARGSLAAQSSRMGAAASSSRWRSASSRASFSAMNCGPGGSAGGARSAMGRRLGLLCFRG